MRTAILIAGILTLLVYPFHSSGAAEGAKLASSSGCTSREKWNLEGTVADPGISDFHEYWEDFQSSISRKASPVRGFSQALSLRRNARSSVLRTLGEYWISRSLYDAKLYHIAAKGFQSLLSQGATDATAPIQLAALSCMNEIRTQYPSIALGVEEKTIQSLSKRSASFSDSDRETIWLASLSLVSGELERRAATGSTKGAPVAALEFLSGSGAYEAFAHGMSSMAQADYKTANTELERFFAAPSQPDNLKRYGDVARLLYARSLYTTGKFKEASEQIKKIKKSSNELVISLQELSWAYLMNDDLNEAIGSATGLQSGKLRGTFAPEAPMVMAMALNELCQYPESIRAINNFRKNYESAYKYLGSLIQKRPNYYSSAVAYIKKTGDVPQRVASEWVRSPLFISSQDELNLLFSEKKSTDTLNQSGRIEQKKLAEDIIKSAKELRPKVRMAREKLKETGKLPGGIQDEIASLRKKVNLFKRIGRAAGTWQLVLTNHRTRVPKLEGELIARINKHLDSVSKRMLTQIEEVAENTQLIEVEILNGASHDIIWQNAHPEYKEFARKLKDQESKADAAKVWDWGRVAVGREEETEVWEDELGTFKADLEDNCGSKDKFLALKLRSGRKPANTATE